MKLEVELERLLELEVDINQFLFLNFIKSKDTGLFDTYMAAYGKFFSKESIDYLLDRGWVSMKDPSLSYRFSNLQTTDKYEEEFYGRRITEDPSSWIKDWLELFPKGVRSGGYLVRSDRAGCLKKMKDFIKRNPEYDRDTIMRATASYIEEKQRANWAYIQLAHYFIERNKISTLASYCENIDETEVVEDKFVKTLNS